MSSRTHNISEESLKRKAEIFKALSHPSRVEIVYLLEKGPLCVCEIVEALGGEFSNISRHISKLAKAGLLTSEKQGTSVIYSLKCKCLIQFMGCIESVTIH